MLASTFFNFFTNFSIFIAKSILQHGKFGFLLALNFSIVKRLSFAFNRPINKNNSSKMNNYVTFE